MDTKFVFENNNTGTVGKTNATDVAVLNFFLVLEIFQNLKMAL